MSRRLSRAALAKALWRVINPPTRRLAGLAPWWVLLETTGYRSGRLRLTPLARGPFRGNSAWLIAVHGRQAAWVRNLEAAPAVRLRHRGRWYPGVATVEEYRDDILGDFSAYARMGPRTLGIDPVLVHIRLTRQRSSPPAAVYARSSSSASLTWSG